MAPKAQHLLSAAPMTMTCHGQTFLEQESLGRLDLMGRLGRQEQMDLLDHKAILVIKDQQDRLAQTAFKVHQATMVGLGLKGHLEMTAQTVDLVPLGLKACKVSLGRQSTSMAQSTMLAIYQTLQQFQMPMAISQMIQDIFGSQTAKAAGSMPAHSKVQPVHLVALGMTVLSAHRVILDLLVHKASLVQRAMMARALRFKAACQIKQRYQQI
jgi:hypothetical protein